MPILVWRMQSSLTMGGLRDLQPDRDRHHFAARRNSGPDGQCYFRIRV